MKKIIYLLLALLVLGGIAYALTQTSLLKGAFQRGDVLSNDQDVKTADAEQLAQMRSQAFEQGVEIAAIATLDTDSDYLSDDFEVKVSGTEYDNPDTDGDGLLDGEELNIKNIYITNPLLADTDAGGMNDGYEVTAKMNPLDASDDIASGNTGELVNFTVKDIGYDPADDYFHVEVCAENLTDPAYDSTIATKLTVYANSTSYDTGAVFTTEGCVSMNANKTVTTDYGIDTTVAGSYEVKAKIDAADKHQESNEEDNMFAKTITFEATANQNPIAGAVDLTIQDLAYNSTTGAIRAYVCVEGTVDPTWGDVSLYVDAIDSNGDMYLTGADNEHSVSAADLVSDNCVTVDTGATVDTSIIDEVAMDIILNIDYTSKITETNEQNNSYTKRVETGVTPVTQEPVAGAVDLTIQDLDYTTSTGAIRAYVCVEGTVDPAWGDVSLYVDAIDSNGDMYLTGADNEHSVSAADLVSDSCVTVDTGAIVDTSLIDEVAMDIILNIDYTSKITETNEQNNSYTERVETGSAQPIDSSVDLTIQDLDYTSSTGAIRAYVCVEGTVDAAWGNVSLSVSATNSTGDEYLTSNDYTVAATDLTSDDCTTVDTGAIVDTTLLTEAAMDITLYIDYKSEITETNEQNNTYTEQVKTAVQSGSSSTYACTEVNIDPDAYTYTVDDGTETVDLNITVKVAKETVSFWNKLGHYLSFLTWGTDWLKASSFIAALDKETTYYSGTLVVEVAASGQGTLMDEKGQTGTSIEIPVFWTSEDIVLEHAVTYSNGNSGDIITAYIKKEVDCKDTLTLAAPAAEETYACTDLELSPSSWDIATDGTSRELTIKTTSDGEKWAGKLTLSTDGTGTLANYDGGSGSSLDFDVLGLEATTYLTYSNAVAGETITASVEGEEQNCTDTLLISETVATTTTTTTPTTTTTTTTTTIDEDSDLNDILVSSAKEVNCDEPYTDVEEEDWEWAYVVLHTCAGIVSGRDADSFVPEGNMTKAEAIKVLMGLAGYDESEGDDLDLDFVDNGIQYHWGRDWMAIAQEEDVIRVRDGELFYPDSPVTRGQFMLYMVRTAGQTLYGWDEDDIPFSDLSKDGPYTYAIIIGNLTLVKETWAGETWTAGYIRESWVEDYSDEYSPLFEGYSDGTSGATDYIARNEAMALALRFYLAYYAE